MIKYCVDCRWAVLDNNKLFCINPEIRTLRKNSVIVLSAINPKTIDKPYLCFWARAAYCLAEGIYYEVSF